MKRQRSLLLATVIVAWLVVLAGCAPPRSGPTTGSASPNLLSGLVQGLDAGDRARMRLERLLEPGLESPGETVHTFRVTSGDWQQPGLILAPGRYRLVPEAEGYVQIPHSIVFQVPEQGFAWRYTGLSFEFLHPQDAPARVGLPLCGDSGGAVPVTPVREATPALPSESGTGQPASPPQAAEPCYANHLATASLVPAGMEGEIRGIGAGETATVRLYAMSDGGVGPEEVLEVTRLEVAPHVAPEATPVAELAVGNGRWGLVDPSLVGARYLVVASAAGHIVSPPGYKVAIVGGKAPGFPSGVDFAFDPEP